MKNIKIKQKKSSVGKDKRAGIVLILALAIVTLMSMLAIAFFSTTETQRVIARGSINRVRAENRAMSGIEVAREVMRSDSKKRLRGEMGVFTDLVYALEGFDLLKDDIVIRINSSNFGGVTYDKDGNMVEADDIEEMTDEDKKYLYYEFWDARHPGTPIPIDWNGLKTPGFTEMSAATYLLKSDSVNESYSYGEPFADDGYEDPDSDEEGEIKTGTAGNGTFDFEDENGNGLHDEGELGEEFVDINGNGAWDDFTSAVRYAADDYWGTYSINVQDTASMIYVNGGIVPGDEWRTRVHTRPIVRMLDNLGVILGVFDEDDTFEVTEREWEEEYPGTDWGNFGRITRSSQTWLTPRPHGKGLGRLLIYGDEDSGIEGRPPNGFTSKAEVLGIVREFSRKNPDYPVSDDQLALLEQIITTEAWVDPNTVTAGRWFYPEEYRAMDEPERWEYAKFEQVEERVYISRTPGHSGGWQSGVNYIVTTANLTAPLIQGRADCDAEPRWYWNEDADDYIKTFGNDYDYSDPDEPDNPDDPRLLYSVTWAYDSSSPILVPMRFPDDGEYDTIIGWERRGENRFMQVRQQEYDESGNWEPTFLAKASQRDMESGDKDDDLDDIMGWVAEPRAPININAASRPVIEAMLAGLTATYVTDRENNLYPNCHSVSDTRKGIQVFIGVPHYPFEFTEFNWGEDDEDCATYVKGDYGDPGEPVYWDIYGGWFKWEKFHIIDLKERANPTIMGKVNYLGPDSTPPVMISPEEARRLAAAIVEYRAGNDTLESDHDLNCNGILDFGDDVDGDGMLRCYDEDLRDDDDEYEWIDTNNDGRYQGGVFESWEEFWVFLNMVKYRVFLNYDKYYEDGREEQRDEEQDDDGNWEENKFIGLDYMGYGKELQSRFTNLADLKVDLIFANCCPNTDARMFNPNASFSAMNRIMPPNPTRWNTGGEDDNGMTYHFARYLKRNVSKRDLFDAEGNPAHTTEFTLWPTGMFQVESTGRVLSRKGDVEAECKIRSVIRAFDRLILTTQADFEIGPEDNYKPGDPDDEIDSFTDKIRNNSNICEKDRIISLPEVDWKQTGLDGNPWKTGWQVNVGQAYVPENLEQWFRNRRVVPSCDGQLCLETRYVTDREMSEGYRINSSVDAQLRAYLRFSQMNDHDGHAEFPEDSGSNKVKYNQDEMGWRLRTGENRIAYLGIPQLRRDDLDPDEYEIEFENDDVTIKEARFRTSPDWADPYYLEEVADEIDFPEPVTDDGRLNYSGGRGRGRRYETEIEVPVLDQYDNPVDLNPEDGIPDTEMKTVNYYAGGERNRYFVEKRLYEPEVFPVCGEGYIYGNMGDPTNPFGLNPIPYEDCEPYDYYRDDYMSAVTHPGNLNATVAWPMTVPKYDMEPRLLPDGFYRNGLKWVQWVLPSHNSKVGDIVPRQYYVERKRLIGWTDPPPPAEPEPIYYYYKVLIYGTKTITPSLSVHYEIEDDKPHMVHGAPLPNSTTNPYFTSYQIADIAYYTEEEFERVQDYWEYCTLEDVLATQQLAATVVMEFWWKPMYTASWNDNSVWDGNQEDYMKATHNLRSARWRGYMLGFGNLAGYYGAGLSRSYQEFLETETIFPYHYFMDEGSLSQMLEEIVGVLDGVNAEPINPSNINHDYDHDGDVDDLDRYLATFASKGSKFILKNQFHPVEKVMYSYEGGAFGTMRGYAYFIQRQRALMFTWGDSGISSLSSVYINYKKQRIADFPYYDVPDMEVSQDYQPDDEDEDAIAAYNFNEGEWVHVAIVSSPERTRLYINGQIPRIWDPKYEEILTAEWAIEDFEARNIAAGEGDIEVEPLANGLLYRVFLTSQNVGTFDEFCYFVIPEYDPDLDQVFNAADSFVRERVSDGRYFGHGEWVSPELRLPIDARIIGITWTEFIPRTLFTGEKRDPNDETNDSSSDFASDILVSLLDKNENSVSDHNGRIDLYCPINNRELFVSMADSAFDGKFRIRIEMDAYPFDDNVPLSDHGFPNEYDFYRTRILSDTPVLDDITIIYSTGEEILSWEIVQ